LGLLERALKDLDQAIQLSPEFAMAYYNRALTYTLVGNDLKARHDAELAAGLGFDRVALERAIEEMKRRR
jgi:tetratricopeptide (TPR) repeat protein